MIRPRHLSILVLFFLAPSAAGAGGELSVEASPLMRRTPNCREALLAQIGGRSSGGKEEKERPREEATVQKVDPRKAMLYSLILPGLGQQVAGRSERARVFYAVEAGIWASFAVFRIQGADRRDRYIEFAEFTAGVDPDGKNDDYWRTIANFRQSENAPGSYNEYIRRQARALYPGDIDRQQEYFEQNGFFGDDSWNWQNSDNLTRYRSLRGKSLDAYDHAELSIMAALANRILSVVDAARVAHQANRADSGRGGREPAHASKDKDKGLLDHALGHFTIKLQRDGDERVPVLAYRTRF